MFAYILYILQQFFYDHLKIADLPPPKSCSLKLELSLEIKDQAMQYSCTLLKQNKGTNNDELVKVTSGCSSTSYYVEKDEAAGSQV